MAPARSGGRLMAHRSLVSLTFCIFGTPSISNLLEQQEIMFFGMPYAN